MRKTIWIFWYQGIDNAPTIVRKCVDSWVLKNPDWSVVILEKENLSKYIDDDFHPLLSIAHRSDLIRLSLLEKYGGLWVDATVYCILPLCNWAPYYFKNGYFVFKNPKNRNSISNWFIYSQPGHVFNTTMICELNGYWNTKILTEGRIKKLAKRVLTSLTCRVDGLYRIWLSILIKDIIKIYPYFIFHFIFREMIEKEPSFRTIFDKIPFCSNIPVHLVQRVGMKSNDIAKLKKLAIKERPFVQKLTYRMDEAYLDNEDNITNCLLEGRIDDIF
ncbi:capsular polysaccharide synthesis protein [Vibrio rotiferianus]|uniref:capsular polysaccharide synthesis protein n=1 Tax=Vibrio rotiferianus TaxID=190895 RepID=UPI003909A307